MKTRWRLDPGQIEVVDDAVAEILRQKSTAQRGEMILAAHRTARLLLTAAVRRQHPDWDARQVAQEVARRLIGGTR
jgi:hypothetical protein